MQLDMFAGKPERTPVDDALREICLGNYPGFAPISAAAQELLGKLQYVGSLPKKDLPYALVEELRRHKLATFTYQGKTVSVRLNVVRIVEMADEVGRKLVEWAA